MKIKLTFAIVIYTILITVIANSFSFVKTCPKSLFVLIPIFILINILSGIFIIKTRRFTLRICSHGAVLLAAFYIAAVLSVIYQIILGIYTIPNDWIFFVWNALFCYCVHFLIFWNGIISVYCTSTQLGIKTRILGAICGLIPIANLIILFVIIKKTAEECIFENKKEEINRQRKDKKICATKYPILLVHGVFFRDTKYFNYWGRIPKELENNGAKIFYGNHSSAACVADSAAELKQRIDEVLKETGTEKLNIIAHSKGGLDCRYAIAKLGIGDKVASLTTINTPHKGCLFADYLLKVIPADIKDKVAKTYNSTLKKLGETQPDFLAAVNDLTDAYCQQLNDEMPTPKGVYCQSVGSVLLKARNGKFPLNFSYHLAKYFDGENDGLVSEKSFAWGEKYTLLKPNEKRGISHGDMIDLNRENILGFDVREFYVELVADLKNRGL